jgi:hypothetical protein
MHRQQTQTNSLGPDRGKPRQDVDPWGSMTRLLAERISRERIFKETHLPNVARRNEPRLLPAAFAVCGETLWPCRRIPLSAQSDSFLRSPL